MTLNATVIVQIFHFIIAYFIIDRLFLSKAVALIQKEKSEQETLMRAIQKERDAVARKQHEKNLAWQEFQRQFQHTAPSLLERPLYAQYEKKVPQCTKVTEHEINEYVARLQKLLMEKVIDDCT
jgi:NAD-dependent oxidoreductase involved in siderophore biosynthesis